MGNTTYLCMYTYTMDGLKVAIYYLGMTDYSSSSPPFTCPPARAFVLISNRKISQTTREREREKKIIESQKKYGDTGGLDTHYPKAGRTLLGLSRHAISLRPANLTISTCCLLVLITETPSSFFFFSYSSRLRLIFSMMANGPAKKKFKKELARDDYRIKEIHHGEKKKRRDGRQRQREVEEEFIHPPGDRHRPARHYHPHYRLKETNEMALSETIATRKTGGGGVPYGWAPMSLESSSTFLVRRCCGSQGPDDNKTTLGYSSSRWLSSKRRGRWWTQRAAAAAARLSSLFTIFDDSIISIVMPTDSLLISALIHSSSRYSFLSSFGCLAHERERKEKSTDKNRQSIYFPVFLFLFHEARTVGLGLAAGNSYLVPYNPARFTDKQSCRQGNPRRAGPHK